MLCIAANENLALNNIKNVLVIPCDSEIFAKRILKNKSYTKEDTGEIFDFKIVLVDPPRYGIVDFNSKGVNSDSKTILNFSNNFLLFLLFLYYLFYAKLCFDSHVLLCHALSSFALLRFVLLYFDSKNISFNSMGFNYQLPLFFCTWYNISERINLLLKLLQTLLLIWMGRGNIIRLNKFNKKGA